MLNPQDWSTRRFWNDWLKHIQKPASKNMSYYNDMVGTIKISHYDDEAIDMSPSRARYSVTLHEIYLHN